MSDTLTRPMLKKTPERNPARWRNLYFTRARGSFWACYCVPTEADCLRWSTIWFAEREAYYRAGGSPLDPVQTWSGAWVPIGEFTFAIPMPWSSADGANDNDRRSLGDT